MLLRLQPPEHLVDGQVAASYLTVALSGYEEETVVSARVAS
ncbi:hypothetical protein Q3A66_20195 [Hymenobacter sp. BT770]|nr:hypothetical protein [Hymenobacter sp. BT770]MDO3417396.1 hypothetical protein [Hymenobacter sp. BT770]